LDEAAREAAARPDRRVTPAVVTERVCESLRLPRFLIDPETPFDPAALAAHLRGRVVGQDEAIDAVVQSLAMYKADLADERRPMGVLLLAGPAGVGKTLLARSVAESVFGSAQRLLRISLGEHSEDWKVDQLFGQRSASAVESRRGLLARHLAGKPFSVLLLDEIEKAHPLAYKHLLRPLDEGMYVNGNDEEVSLRNTLVILTSSVGAEVYREPALGFARGEAGGGRAESVRKRLADIFPWDLLDRIDRVCVCAPLGSEQLREVARREIAAALARAGVHRRRLEVVVDDDVVARVIAEGVAQQGTGSGARAVRRAVERAVVRPLALYLLQHEPAAGARLRVTVRDGAIVPTGMRPPGGEVARVRGELRVSGGGRRAAPPAVAPTAAPATLAEGGKLVPAVRGAEPVTARRSPRAPR
jgi:ATP-dependent Clp protease ATP-binding subunit ClpA